MVDPTVRVIAFLIIVGITVGVFLNQMFQLFDYWRLGQPDSRSSEVRERLREVLVNVLGQKWMFRFTYSGVLHLFIMYAFIILLAVLAQMFGEAFFGLGWDLGKLFGPVVGPPISYLLSFSIDLIIVLGLVGVIMAFYQRIVRRPFRFDGSHWRDAFFILVVITFELLFTLFAAATSRQLIAMGTGLFPWEPEPKPLLAQPVSAPLGMALGGLGVPGLTLLFQVAWWGHVILLFSFLTYLRISKHFHILVAGPNVFLRDLTPPGAITPLNLEDVEAESFGVGKFEDFTWKHILDFYACTECGRCMAVCPAVMSGTTLNPKLLMMDLRHHVDIVGPYALQQAKGVNGDATKFREEHPLIRGAVLESTLWACTTCRACMYECPLFIEHVDDILDMRRYLALTEGSMPDQLALAMQQAERKGNPWGNPPSSRMDWAQGLNVPVMAEKGNADVLYWVGCAGSYDPNSQKTTKAVVKILKAAGVDFAVLGEEERCNCEFARRGGNEALYQERTQENVEVLKQYHFKTIITHCPHCFNTLKNEYPQFGGNFEVMHHTQFIDKLIAEGKIRPNGAKNEKITFHDSCYLGRYNGVYDSPRHLIEAVPGMSPVEMERSRDRGLCCGGGGARVWFELESPKQVNDIRFDEAMSYNPDVIGTACPFCTIMLDSSRQSKGMTEKVKVRDVAEILAESLDVGVEGKQVPVAAD